MSCVNKSSREFKKLAQDNNVSSNTLELIIHKYWLETGSEENFPTDVYIQAQLGNGQYKESISAVRKLWQRDYQHPQDFNTLKDVERAYDKALSFFPAEAIYYYKSRQGGYTLTVKQPVTNPVTTAKTFFEADGNVRKLDLGLQEGVPQSIDKVQKLYNQFNNDRTTRRLADKVFSIAKELGMQTTFDESLPGTTVGRYTNNNSITYRKSFFEKDANASKKAPIILHEMIHAVSMYALSDQTADWHRTAPVEKFRREAYDIFEKVRYNKALEGERGTHNVFEFVAELSNPIFRQKLQSIDNRKWYTKILDAFKSLFGIHSSSTYYNRMMNALDGALEAFDMNSYMEYNGIKSQLQQVYNDHRVDFEEMSDSELKTMLKDAIKENKSRSDKKEYNNGTDRLSLHQRFSQEELRGCSGRLEEAEALLQRGGHSSTPEKSGDVTGVTWQGKEAVVAKKQIATLESWAKKNKIWSDNTSKHLQNKYGKVYAGGGEAQVYLSHDGTKVIKEIRLDYYIEPQLLLDRIVLHNYLFSNTALTVTGFGKNSDGNFVVIAEQPFIQGEYITQEEIKKYMTSMGFVPYNNRGTEFINREKGIIVNDLHDENVIKTPHGYTVIDADVRLNTANYKLDGARVTDGSNTEVSSFIDSMSKDQLISQLKQIKQEYADFELINDTQEESKKPVSATFKFNDGTEVRAPFKPNDQQAEALNTMSDFLNSSENTMTLSGYAGTGKTSVMEILARKAQRDGKYLKFCATTNQAANVLSTKLEKLGLEAQTLNKVFGISVEIDSTKAYDAKNLVNVLREANVEGVDAVVIDEASMINTPNYNILKQIAEANNVKIIYVGDRAQLAPVGEDKVSPVFRNSDGKVIELTKVERTDDNAVLKEATRIRNGEGMSYESSFNKEGKGVAFLNPDGEHRQEIVDTINHFIPGLKKDPNHFRILSYTNESVEKYNNYVRKKLGYDSTPQKGEPIMGYANWGYNWRTKTYRFINSGAYTVVSTQSPIQKTIVINGKKVTMNVIPLRLKDSTGTIDTFNFMDIKNDAANRQAAILLATMKKRLWERARTAPKNVKKEIYQQINSIDEFLFVNDNIKDNEGHFLQTKTFDFGYAHTIHKSQGSTFTNVLLDAKNIERAPTKHQTSITVNTTQNPWEAVSPATAQDVAYNTANDPSKATMIGTPDEVDLGLGEETSVNTPTAAANNDVADIRQQLEYVGVSRATDTVTVITNDAKKEDSALNHLKEKGADKPVKETPRPEVPVVEEQIQPVETAPSQPNQDSTPLDAASQHEITNQLVDHLKGMGITVKGRADMEKSLAEHPEEFRIESIFGIDTNYLNQDHLDVIPDIQKIIEDKKYNKAGTDVVKLEGDNKIYLIDHSTDEEYKVHREEGRHGVGIRKVYDLDNLTTNDIKEIIRNAAPGYEYSANRVRHLLQTLGIEEGHMSGIDFDAEIRKAADAGTDAVHGQKRQGKGAGYYGFRGYNNNGGEGGRTSQRPVGQSQERQLFVTPNGEVYGFINKDGEIYLDETKISPEHPIHEYTHLWDNTLIKRNPALWNRGKSLMKEIPLWNEILNNPNYGKKWQAQGIDKDVLEQLVASEVHARLVGESGKTILEKLAKSKGTSGIVAKLKQWLLDVYKYLKGTFTPWTKNELDKLTLKEFNRMTLRDFVRGINPNVAAKGLRDFTLHSVEGSEWANTGMVDYRTKVDYHKNSDILSDTEVAEADAHLRKANETLGRTYPTKNNNVNNDFRKSWFQIKDADAVFAVADVDRGSIQGGTAWAVQMAIDNNKPVYVFNQGQNKWFTYRDKAWVETETPMLTPTFAGFEPIELSASGRKAIEDVYQKTYDNAIKTNSNTLSKVEDTTENNSQDNIPDTDISQFFNNDEEMLQWKNSHRIELPGYETWNNLYEDTYVDFAWKVPQLKELDEQLSVANTQEQNNEIINLMNDVLIAATEDDIKPVSSKKRKEIQKNLDDYEKLNTQFDRLLDGRYAEDGDGEGETIEESFEVKFTASQLRHVAELVGDHFSDLITKIQTEEGAVKEMFPLLSFKEDVDFTTMSREKVVETIDIQNLINYLKEGFDPAGSHWFATEDSGENMPKGWLLMENWDAFMQMASDIIALNEGFSIERDHSSSKFNLNKGEKQQVAYDDFNGYQDEDTLNETEGDAQEHWQIESRTIDVLNSMSALVRQAIHQCYILDSNGNKVMDENWQKLPLRVNARNATNSILRWSQGALTLEDMITKLQAKQADNPWVSQLIDRLSDKTGKEADFQSQFFGVFAKHFQLYNVVQLDNGKYTSMPVNSHPALSEALTTINAQIKMGEHPLFHANGKIKADMLGNEKTIGDDASFNLYQAYHHLDTLVDGGLIYLDKKDYMDNLVNYNEDVAKEAAKWIAGSFRVLGYPVTEEMIMQVANPQTIKMLGVRIGYIVRDLTKELKTQKGKANSAINYDPMAYFGKNNIGGTIRNLLTPVTDSLEDIAVSAFYDSGKMYQSYVTPSFMTKLMQKLKSENKFKFIEEEYGNSEWFRDPKTKEWRLDILNRLPEKFDFKVELNFNKHNYMRNMSDAEYTLSLITEFFADGWNPSGRSESTAWYAMPMQSNKPSSEFVRLFLYKDEGGGSTYKDTITNKLYKMFLQELSRIQTVNMRGLNPKTDSEAIKNFDTNGRKFCFLPFLNGYLKEGSKTDRNLLRNEDNTVSEDNETLARLLQRKLEGLETSQLSADEEATLVALTKKAIQNYMEARASEIMDAWERSGIVEAARSIKNIVKGESFLHSDMKQDNPERNKWVKESLEMFLWNDYLAKKQILQLTVGDIAFYKDMEDLQKRLSQLHAPGVRGNIYATDYQGNRVSDGKYRTLVLNDWDNFISTIIDNITEVFDRKIAAAPESQKAQMRALKESLVGENGAYRKINVADAQGLSSPSSYRKKAFIFGKWSQHYEDIYQKLLKGDYNYTDLQTAFQPLKPFVYTLLDKSMGVPGAPITRMKVPFQAKNSEYLLIMADAILKGDEAAGNRLGRPNLLKAIYRVMEDSEKLNPTKGIDTVQFESAIKSGLQGRINLHQFANLPGGEEAAYTLMMDSIYKKGADGKRTTEYNVDTFVHEASYEDYCLQQEVPEHFRNHSQAHGSQERMIIPSDLDLYVDDNADHNDPNNINYYEWTEPDGTKRKVTAKEFRQEYEETIAQSISNDIASLQQELHLDSDDKKERNIALSKILQREILSSPRYGVDLLQACSVDKETGEFRMPKGDPIQSKRIEQLLNSIIKNRINKQKIAGGPIVQVSNYGTSRQLNIRFKDKQGNILKTRQEYEQQQEQSELQKVLSGSDRTIDEAKRVLKRGDGKSVQENQLEVYARSKGLWREGEVTEQLEQQYGKKIGHGGESFVYRKDGHTVIKAKDNIYDNVYDALESIQIHNTLFPSTKITLVGIGRSEGELTFIVEQPYVGGREATKKEIQDFVSSKLDGTLNESVLGGHSYQNDIYKLQDLKPANVLVEPNGNLQVIDGDFYLKEEQQQYASYEEYVKANQAGIAYFEVFAPIWSEELFEKFADENGNIDMAAVENACPELLDMVSYRIPTEDKYSIAPMRVVGFMPREAGDAIMLPYDLTTIDDSDFDVDKRYVMRKTGQIKKKHTSEIFKSMYDIVSQEYAAQHKGKVNKQYLKDQLHMFLDNPEKMKNMDALMKHFNNIYRRVAYTVELPASGKNYRDNKIIDMTLAVLTNERTADKLLNPGGFEEVAKIGYQIAAYRSEGVTRDGLSWNNLSAMSEDELKALSYKSKDIAWTDTQVQFYKQNAATSSMIGIFAVSKIAHAILESNGIYLNLDNVIEPFTIAGMQFGGRMEVDPKYDREGNMIGKVAGSLVSASADGVKKPVLDLMNISPATAGVLNTMLRLGMPLKQAALFMSQDAITRLLKEFNNRRLSNYVTLNSLIDEYMTAFEKAHNITDGSTIKTEELSEKELIEGLKPREHKTIDYKVMLALSKLLDINKEMKDITFATRFNSISSAVGPLIIDNLILLHKMEQFGLNSSGMKETNFCNAEGDMIDIEEVFDMHPILREFSKAVSIAANIFSDMPAGSKKFKDILDGMPDYLQDKMYRDRKLLSQLSDFYQSYLLVASGLIDTSQLKYYMEEFPKEFISKNFKDKYSDNMLIQAIKPNVYRKSNRAVLEIKTTGMDTQQKEELSSAWIDLHKEDPELSKKLFIYNFFKAGIGFSPKTFMSLVPMYVKEKMSNGDATYVGTFRSLPEVTNEVVVDQFVRNNWNDNKLVPWKGGKNSHFHFDYKSGIVEVYDKNDIRDLNGTVYFKNKANKTTYLWRLIKSASTQDKLFFERVTPLGNNGEYFEVSKDTIQKTLTDTTESNVDNAPAELQEQSPAEESESNTSVENAKQGEYSVQRMLDLLAMQNPALKGQEGVERLEDMKASPNGYAKFLVNVFKNIGLELSPKEALEEFKKYC